VARRWDQLRRDSFGKRKRPHRTPFHPARFRQQMKMSLKYPNRIVPAPSQILWGADIENGMRTGTDRLFDVID
jgi:hypothetical protein